MILTLARFKVFKKEMGYFFESTFFNFIRSSVSDNNKSTETASV